MNDATIVVERAGAIATLTLNRPDVLNAMSRAMNAEFAHAIRELDSDENIRVVVVTGAGAKAFSAGADIHEQVATADRSPDELARMQVAPQASGWELAACAKPTIGAINGLAFGGAALMASSLDIRIGCEHTKFRFMATVYAVNSTWTLPLVVGLPKAKELFFTSRVIEAEEALEIGLLNKLVASEKLMEEALAMARSIASNDPVKVQGVKKLLHQQVGMGYIERWNNEREASKTWLRPKPPREAHRDFLKGHGNDQPPQGGSTEEMRRA